MTFQALLNSVISSVFEDFRFLGLFASKNFFIFYWLVSSKMGFGDFRQVMQSSHMFLNSKSEYRNSKQIYLINPKLEIRNTKQIQNSKFKCSNTKSFRIYCFGH